MKPNADWGKQYGGGLLTPSGRVWMFRKGVRVRFFDEEGNQVGPEHSNVAPAVAYAMSKGWRDMPDSMNKNAKLPKGIREVRGESSQVSKGDIASVPRSREHEEADWSWIRKNAKGKLYIEVRPSKGNNWLPNLDQEFTADGVRDARKYAFELLLGGDADAVTIMGWGSRWSSRGGSDLARLYEFGEYELGSAYDVETVNRIDVLIRSLGEIDHQREVELMSGVQESRYFQGTMRAVTESDLRDVLYRLQAQRRVAEERGHEPNAAARFKIRKGQKAMKCRRCGKLTMDEHWSRGPEMCGSCLEEAGLENEHEDVGHPQPKRGCPLCEGQTPNPKEKFTIVTVTSPRQGSWLVEIDGGTSFLTARVYDSGRGRFIAPTSGWDVRKYDRPTEKEADKILAAVEKFEDAQPDERHEPNASSYYVWVIGSNNRPLDEGPFGPHDLEGAKTFARISATEGGHDRAVSRGLDPKASSFEIVRRYRAGSGEQVL